MNVTKQGLIRGRTWPERPNPGELRASAAATERSAKLAEQAAAVERSLTYQFPSQKKLKAFYAQIDVPAGLTFPDGSGAWYGLNVLDIPGKAGQGLLWTGLNTCLWPCDVAAVGRSSPFTAGAGGWLAWGDTAVTTNQRNTHAYIVAGVGLPWVQYQTWTTGPRLAGQAQTTAEKYTAPQALDEWIAVPFPPGTFTATSTTSQKTVIENSLPLQIPLVDGSRFSIALCIAPRSVNNLASASSIACAIDVTATFGTRYADRVFQS